MDYADRFGDSDVYCPQEQQMRALKSVAAG